MFTPSAQCDGPYQVKVTSIIRGHSGQRNAFGKELNNANELKYTSLA